MTVWCLLTIQLSQSDLPFSWIPHTVGSNVGVNANVANSWLYSGDTSEIIFKTRHLHFPHEIRSFDVKNRNNTLKSNKVVAQTQQHGTPIQPLPKGDERRAAVVCALKKSTFVVVLGTGISQLLKCFLATKLGNNEIVIFTHTLLLM